jgi:hypothetical protein
MYPEQKICLFADSAPAYTAKNTQRLLVEFWFLAYSLDLNLGASCVLRLLRLAQILAPYVHLSLQTRTDKWLYISTKHAAHSAATAKPLLRKMKLKLNRW